MEESFSGATTKQIAKNLLKNANEDWETALQSKDSSAIVLAAIFLRSAKSRYATAYEKPRYRSCV
jgi:hypothetical protein